jgi:glycosyltransferase involved in cell wall biosynthesis
VQHIPNGVRSDFVQEMQRGWRRSFARRNLKLDSDRKVVLVLGRIDLSKGVDLLPAVSERIADINPLIVCVGTGELEGFLQKSEPCAKGLIQLAGHLNDVSVWLDAADVLFLPSRIEGDPLVFLEAAAARCPVVASDAALDAYGTDAHELALIAEMDNVEQLSERLRFALTETRLLTNQLKNAVQKSKEFDDLRMIEAYMTLCRMTYTKNHFLRRAGNIHQR